MADLEDIENEETIEPAQAPEGEPAEDSEVDTDEDTDDSEGSESGEDEIEGETETKPSAAPVNRKENRINTLLERTRQAEERAARAEALAEERARNQQRTVSAEQAKREREEKLALMDPMERTAYLQNEQLETMRNQLMYSEIRTQDMIDKSEFRAKAVSNPVYAKHESDVERRLNGYRSQGVNKTREQVLVEILGEKALNTKPNDKKKQEAQRRIASTKTNPVSVRNNVSSGYRAAKGPETLADLERRLGDVLI